MKDQALWNRVDAFEFTADSVGNDLSERVRVRTGWTEDQALQAIREYRRFLYLYGLTKTAKRSVGASLDQVWQAHRSDPAGYDADCQTLFGRTLPYVDRFTGQDQERTRKAYRAEFGARAPAQYWPDPNAKLVRIAAVGLALAGLVLTLVSGSIWPVVLGIVVSVGVLVSPISGDNTGMGDHSVTGWDDGGFDGGGGD